MDGVVIAGILNVTPDSFSDGGEFLLTEGAVARGLEMAGEGAHWIDVGGESTRPGALAVSAEEETARVVPVIRALASALPEHLLSIDTSKASVAEAALEAGAHIVNDVTGLEDPDMAHTVARYGAHLVVMHMRGTPRSMQANTTYQDLLGDIERALHEKTAIAHKAGIPHEHIVLDPGIGFGKAPEDNALLIQHVQRWKSRGHRVMIGASRKSFLGHLTGVAEPKSRLAGSLGAALAAAANGADILRVHDVKETRDALVVFEACRRTG